MDASNSTLCTIATHASAFFCDIRLRVAELIAAQAMAGRLEQIAHLRSA
jgi:hypothetical protein